MNFAGLINTKFRRTISRTFYTFHEYEGDYFVEKEIYQYGYDFETKKNTLLRLSSKESIDKWRNRKNSSDYEIRFIEFNNEDKGFEEVKEFIYRRKRNGRIK